MAVGYFAPWFANSGIGMRPHDAKVYLTMMFVSITNVSSSFFFEREREGKGGRKRGRKTSM